jgi:cobalt-zinc-cadmium efflux system outer membrane protein
MVTTRWVNFLLLAFCLSGCAKIPKYSEEEIAGIVAARIDKEVQWKKGCYEDPQIKSYIQDLACQPLTPEAVVQIALLNNPQIQAIFEELGIAQADLIEAGLLSNPAFEVEVRYPHERKLKTNIEYLVTATFLDIFLIPLRTRLASTELEQAKLRVSNEILDLSFEVRQTYYELVAQIQKLQYTQAIVELTSIHNEIVMRQNRIGNVNLLDFQQTQARFLEAKLEITKSQSEIIRLREKLNRLLGFSEEMFLNLSNELPEEADYQGFDLCILESLALDQRLDIQVARFEIARISRMLGLKDWWTYTNLKAGLAGERDPDGTNLVGYGIAGEVPIFNYGQAARMRLFAQLRQARDRLAVLEIQALSEVREAHRLLMNDLEIINNYRGQILPIQNKILTSSEELYNVMGLGIDRLLENKRQEIEAYRNYLESLKDYWVARVQIDKALGGHLFRLLTPVNCIEGVIE